MELQTGKNQILKVDQYGKGIMCEDKKDILDNYVISK